MKILEKGFGNEVQGTEKLKRLSQERKKVDYIIDKLGLGVDEGIKDTVAILRTMGYPTDSSCAGHTDKHKYAPPYVQIYEPGPDGWKSDIVKQEKWKTANNEHFKKMLPLVEKFNALRDSIPDAKLCLTNIGAFGGFRIESSGVKKDRRKTNIVTEREACSLIRIMQKEMKDFTYFLQQDYLRS